MNLPIVSAPPGGPGPAEPQRAVTISVVSHGHGALVAALLQVLAARHEGLVAHVVLTHNMAEPAVPAPQGGWPFRLTELFNDAALGFGTNHNRAFAHCDTGYFCVLNPDVELPVGPLWEPLLALAAQPETGCVYPGLLNPDGTTQDSEREAVTPLALLRRHLLRQPQTRVDWVSAAFWLVPQAVYQRLGGFDERFFMYCEDTDFCLRLRLAGLVLRRCNVQVVHAASRASRRPGQHLGWHLGSLMRLWAGPVLRQYITRMRDGSIVPTLRQ